MNLRAASARRPGISTVVVAAAVVIVVAVAGVGFYLAFMAPNKAPGSTSSTIESVTIDVPPGAINQPSGWVATNSNATMGAVISGLFFSPDNITVVIGFNNTVIWDNPTSGTAYTHNLMSTSVPSGASAFNLPLNPDSTVSYTFTVAGVYFYRCSLHPWMGGEIVVKAG